MELTAHYIIIPTDKGIWNEKAFIEQVRTHYSSKAKAIEKAKSLSKQYNSDFYIMKLETLVQNVFVLTDVKE